MGYGNFLIIRLKTEVKVQALFPATIDPRREGVGIAHLRFGDGVC